MKVFGGELYRAWIIDVDEDDEQGDVITVKYEDGDGGDLNAKYYVCNRVQTCHPVTLGSIAGGFGKYFTWIAGGAGKYRRQVWRYNCYS